MKKLERLLQKAELRVEALKKEECLYDNETYHNMKGWKVAEGTRELYQKVLSGAVKELDEALERGRDYDINDAGIKLKTIYGLVEQVLEMHNCGE